MTKIKTNAAQYADAIIHIPLRLPLSWRIAHKVKRVGKLFGRIDDFDWDDYNTHYRAEFEWSSRFFTFDFDQVDYKIIDGRIYLLGDCKPLHLTHRCVWESIVNLPSVSSICEMGVGCGFFIIGLKRLMAQQIRYSAYDLNPRQLQFFEELWPVEYKEIAPEILDLTKASIPEVKRTDLVYESTVLMHIQREKEYQAALRNFVLSGNKFAVFMDHWIRHDYFGDLNALIRDSSMKMEKGSLYTYDSGGNIAVILSKEAPLGAPYQPLTDASILKKYL